MAIKSPLKFFVFTASIVIGFYAFARMGMHVADDGILLAATKRIIIDGEIPHRDFISLRPLGTFIFWAPTVLFGGEYTNTLSRLVVMLQFGLIAFFWLSLLERHADFKLKSFYWSLLYIVTYFFCFNTFWLFPLYTTDGVFFSSLGIWLTYSDRKDLKYLGFFFVGLASLSKQNFAAMIPATLLATKHFKDYKAYFAALAAPFLYFVWMSMTGALSDFRLQMSQYPFSTTFLNAGVFPYLKSKYFFMGLGLGITAILPEKWKGKQIKVLVSLFFLAHIIQTLLLKGYLSRVPIFLAGFAIPLMIHYLSKKSFSLATHLFLGCSLAWVSSFSLAFQYPHAAGYLVPAIIFYLFKNFPINQRSYKPLSVLLTIVLCFSFTYHRYTYTFENNTAFHTPHVIKNEYPGAKGMVVGKLMFDIFKDLNSKFNKYQQSDTKVAILPDFTNYWVTRNQKNPLPHLWLVATDIVSEPLISRITNRINQLESGSIFIIENYHGYSLHWKPNGEQVLIKPTNWDFIINRVLEHIKSNSKLIETSQFFDIYEKL